MARIAVFCGSSLPCSPKIREVARQLGERIAANGHDLIYGGSNLGLMGLVSDAAKKGNAHVTAVIPKLFPEKIIYSQPVDEIIVTHDMAERKKTIIEKSDIFVALPGGIGTLDEVTEVMVAVQLKQVAKPMVLFNIDGYFDNFVSQLATMRTEGMLSSDCGLKVYGELDDCELI